MILDRGMPDQSLMVMAGDCVMFRSDVWHRGGGNTCGEQRHIIQNHYCSRWLAERFQEGWEEERVLFERYSETPWLFDVTGASSKQRELLEPVLAWRDSTGGSAGPSYQQAIAAAMRAELRSLGRSSEGGKGELVKRLNDRASE